MKFCSKNQSPKQTPPISMNYILPVSKLLYTATVILTQLQRSQPRFSEAQPPKVKNTAQAENPPYYTDQQVGHL